MSCSKLFLLPCALCILTFGCRESQPPPAERTTNAVVPPQAGISDGLKRSDAPIFALFVDQIGPAKNPLGEKLIKLPAEGSTITGWAVYQDHSSPAGGLELLIDGKPYAIPYGVDRADVADSFKNPALKNSGFKGPLPPLAEGNHTIAVRILSRDKSFYSQSPEIGVSVQ